MTQGQDAARQLSQAVASGQVKLSEDAAREVAGHYVWFAEEMVARQREFERLQRLDGFGDFASAQHLQRGFEGKARQAFDAYKAAEVAAHRMAAAIFQAGGLIEEAERENAAQIQSVDKRIPDAQS